MHILTSQTGEGSMNWICKSKKLESEQIKNPQMKSKLEIIKIKGEINIIESNSSMRLINKTRSWYFEKTNNIEKVLVNLI